MNITQQLNIFIKKPAVKSAGIYTFSNFFSKSVGFFLLFIYSNPRYLNVDENGLLSLLTGAIAIFVPFLSLGIVHSTSVEFFKLKKNEFKDLFTTGFVFPFIALILGMAGLYFFKTDLNNSYQFPASFAFIIPIIAFFTFCNELLVTLIRSNDEPITYLKMSLLRLVIEASLSILLVVNFAMRWQGRVIAMILACTVLFVAAFFYFKEKGYLFGRIKFKYLKDELKYGVPIIIFQGSSFCLFSSDKFFLSYFDGNAHVGIYAYVCTFCAVLSVGCTAVLNYILPKIYEHLSQPKINYGQIRTYFVYYFYFAFSSLLCIIAFTPLLYKYFINEKYYPGLSYLYLVAIGYFFWNINYFFYSFLLYKKNKKKIFLLSLFSIAISIGSNYVFIKNWHSQGAAFSVLISFFLVLLVTLFSNKREAKLILLNAIFKEK
ncbi:MAG: lipopolysaccharide biosynthesis protein [Ginsengibacter sp.]